jgi:hypothetical protein
MQVVMSCYYCAALASSSACTPSSHAPPLPPLQQHGLSLGFPTCSYLLLPYKLVSNSKPVPLPSLLSVSHRLPALSPPPGSPPLQKRHQDSLQSYFTRACPALSSCHMAATSAAAAPSTLLTHPAAVTHDSPPSSSPLTTSSSVEEDSLPLPPPILLIHRHVYYNFTGLYFIFPPSSNGTWGSHILTILKKVKLIATSFDL